MIHSGWRVLTYLPPEDLELLLAETALHELQLPIVLHHPLLLACSGPRLRLRLGLRLELGLLTSYHLPLTTNYLLLLARVDAVELGLEVGHVAPALQVARVLHVEVRLEPLILVHEGGPHLV